MRRPRTWLALLLLASAAPASAQGTRDDYARADALRERFRDKLARHEVRPHWSDKGATFWYRNDLGGGAREFVRVVAEKGERAPAFDHAKVAEALAKATDQPAEADKLPFDRIALDDGTVRFEARGKVWRFDPASGELTPTDAAAPPADEPARRRGPRRESGGRPDASPRGEDSPDGKWSAFVRDHNLHLRDKANGAVTPLTFEGAPGDAYDSGVAWSPDSAHLVALRTAAGDERKVYLIESSPADQLQPKLQSYDYRKPGDRVPLTKPHLFDVAARREVPIKDDLFPDPWSLDRVRWDRDGRRFTFLYNQRGHQVLRLIAVDANDGTARAIIDEHFPTFVDYSQKMFLRWLGDGEIVWASERDGWNHLYLIDAATGDVKRQLTRGEWVVRGVDRVDDDGRTVWFQAGGIRPGQDPYYVHHARVGLDGGEPVVLTEGDGTHEVEFSPDRQWIVDTYSRVDLPPVVELRSAEDGRLVCPLERADAAALVEAGWRAPERFAAKGRDGKTDIYGVIFTPTNFDPRKTYPVIEQIYAGPQGAFVPKRFATLHGPQALAELGFVTVQIDGMGTNWRLKAFHDVCARDLADAGFPDRIAWLKAAAADRPWMDLGRVGLYGGSAGGQNALGGLLFHGDIYKVAVADCGCHDNRMDKIWWNEAWMGWPIGPHYAASSNVVNAHRLRGKLLLTVGELDRNVDPASTMQVVNALIKAGKDFDLVVFPGAGHGAGGSPYGQRRLRDFFVRHLLGVQPPDWNAGPEGDPAG